jgi:hypothetical protein
VPVIGMLVVKLYIHDLLFSSPAGTAISIVICGQGDPSRETASGLKALNYS